MRELFYYKMRQVFYYKVGQFCYKIRQLLQNTSVFLQMPQLLQNALFITKCGTNMIFHARSTHMINAVILVTSRVLP